MYLILIVLSSLRVHKERLLQVPWVVGVVEVPSVAGVVDEECGDDRKMFSFGLAFVSVYCLSVLIHGRYFC